MTSTAIQPDRAHSDAFEVIVLSGSAGGLEAVSAVLSSLPATFPVPIVVVLHHGAGRGPIVQQILQRSTALQVSVARDEDVLTPGFVYLAPADRHLSVSAGGRLESTDHRKINYLHSSAEPLLDSVVSEFGSRAIAVILSGSGKNGSMGAKRLHDAGGVVLAQNAETSRNFGMPSAAIELGAVDRVLPLEDIGRTLLSLTRSKS
jgi:two-component system chemotaxis response regulator CheB